MVRSCGVRGTIVGLCLRLFRQLAYVSVRLPGDAFNNNARGSWRVDLDFEASGGIEGSGGDGGDKRGRGDSGNGDESEDESGKDESGDESEDGDSSSDEDEDEDEGDCGSYDGSDD